MTGRRFFMKFSKNPQKTKKKVEKPMDFFGQT